MKDLDHHIGGARVEIYRLSTENGRQWARCFPLSSPVLSPSTLSLRFASDAEATGADMRADRGAPVTFCGVSPALAAAGAFGTGRPAFRSMMQMMLNLSMASLVSKKLHFSVPTLLLSLEVSFTFMMPGRRSFEWTIPVTIMRWLCCRGFDRVPVMHHFLRCPRWAQWSGAQQFSSVSRCRTA